MNKLKIQGESVLENKNLVMLQFLNVMLLMLDVAAGTKRRKSIKKKRYMRYTLEIYKYAFSSSFISSLEHDKVKERISINYSFTALFKTPQPPHYF